jgi:anaerobic magnesium-protoporphyrin IX monomethyl ester cyclase
MTGHTTLHFSARIQPGTRVKSIVLIRPGYSDRIYGTIYEQKSDTRREIRPPLGLMAIAGYLKTFGHTVHIVDGEPDLLSAGEIIDLVLSLKPDIVGVTATTPEYPFASEIIRAIKRVDNKLFTVLGGAHITALPEHTINDLADDLDWGVLYEGEAPMAAIAADAASEFIWKADHSSKILMARERVSGQALSSFFPDRDCLDMSVYRYVDTSLGLVQNDAIEMARGCPFGCTFCTSRRTPIEARQIGHIVDEIIDSAKRFGTKLFMFFDDTFTVHRERAVHLFEALIEKRRRGILSDDVHFSGFTRANSLDADLLRRMREAGCDKLSLGIETGNSDLLRSMQKGTKLEDYREAYKMIEEVGIAKRGSFIIGHPFETIETVRDSIRFAIELDLDEIGVNIMTPYPGQLTFRDAYEGKGIWFAHEVHYPELRGEKRLDDTWADFRQANWHDYWREHLRWGKAVVETEALSADALVYWHSRFLQEVYGSEKMAKRRQKQIERGNNDEYWHRPWRIHAKKHLERQELEQHGEPRFSDPMHTKHRYTPADLVDYQKNELHRKSGLRESHAERVRATADRGVGKMTHA